MTSISIVLYNTKQKDINNLITSLNTLSSEIKVFIIDNSPSNYLASFFVKRENTIYIHNPDNPGFGASHNIAFKEAIDQGFEFHFVVNPDAIFCNDVITQMTFFLQNNNNVGMLMPQILNLDGTIQYLPKLLPSPFSIVLRKLKKPKSIYKKFIDDYELRSVAPNHTYEAPILSGCFTAFRLKAISEIGMYDDRFFMYFEDWDLSRRMHQKYQTIYFPKVSIFHGYESGANKSKKLFKIFVKSAIHYFNKWGWFFDSKRSLINKQTLKQFK